MEALRILNTDLVLEQLQRLALSRITLDVDGTVVRTGMQVAWAFRGFNPHHRKNPSYYPLLAHIAQTYFFVRLPLGTYETELVTKVFDARSIPLLIVALLEGSVKRLEGVPTPWVGFFWGMLTAIVSLILLINQPETWVCMVITVVATGLGIAALVANRGAGEPA